LYGEHAVIIEPNDPILITGAAGFIGSKVVECLIQKGFRNLRCFARPSSNLAYIRALSYRTEHLRLEIVKGNLLSPADCDAATEGVKLILHLAAGVGEDSFAEAYRNSVVTTKNLLESSLRHSSLRRFVSLSSFSVYSNKGKRQPHVLDESCPVEEHPEVQGDAYSFAKAKQDQLVIEYCNRFDIPYVLVRPGYVYGPGKDAMNGRVGTGTFGLFLHLGGSNTIPFTYVDNCAEAIVMVGVKEGLDGEVFNVVDDGLPSSRTFLRLYKRNVTRFPSLYIPHAISYLLCYLWELYSTWSEGQLPPAFNRARWHSSWKSTRFSNVKLKSQVGWAPRVSTTEGFKRYFESCRVGEHRA
jgi:nucleoside-diphosphate-sugar epimerase